MQQAPKFELVVLGVTDWNHFDDNLDVEVRLGDGRRYTATFFTITNIEAMFRKNRQTGECANGLYFWSTEMVIVAELDITTMQKVVEGLMLEDEFERVFKKIPDGPQLA